MPTTRQKQKEPVSDVDRFEKRQVAARAFSPAAPIDEERLFAGRAAQVAQVVDVINQRGQHAVIFGERGVGKTSLANIISAKLAHENNEPLIATRINCETKDTHASLWRKVFQQIDLQQRVRVIGFTQEERFKPFSVADELRRRVSADDVRRLFTVLGVDRSTLLLVILDEFDRITDKATKTAMADTIKTLSDHATPVTIILVGVGDSVDELIAEHHSIERALVQIHMPRMSSPELRDILARALSRAKLAIRPDASAGSLRRARGNRSRSANHLGKPHRKSNPERTGRSAAVHTKCLLSSHLKRQKWPTSFAGAFSVCDVEDRRAWVFFSRRYSRAAAGSFRQILSDSRLL
jgi:Cdc6-like AAA superfamily ATPase